MKKRHIFILVLIAIFLMGSLFFIGDLSTYANIAYAKEHKGKTLSIIGKIDASKAIVYNPIQDPNYTAFTLTDSTGSRIVVVYRNAKPTDIEKSERLVLKGKVNEKDVFECKEILMKCPSKYNDGQMSDAGSSARIVSE